MAPRLLSTANTFHSSSSSSPLSRSRFGCLHCHNNAGRLIICKGINDPPSQIPALTKRTLSICFVSTFIFPLVGRGSSDANAAILEADDDEELLEKVKKDRKKRLERQGVISSANKETAYLQEVVYKLSKVGQAIDNNDFSTASSVLGGSSDADWVRNANSAFNKLSSSPEEKSEVDTFNSSIASLISSVTQNDVESSKTAFVASASALEKWTALAGLIGQLKGL
ncbi:thylakoid lumenal 16.5 kDa protein, chloroplastic [Momordica charantia]|uniref:Thylakoid lumenal 16.5 kDa protein, chloroplastic n=1 Tax=Momordica charantia TaxID=3673 RepID=A0A6J1CQ84_MOMCH|nr:thylakoid lumenal 16.5 kDa protein, chloroplastic [Momordica charantia]